MHKQTLFTRRTAILGAAAAGLSVGQVSAASVDAFWWRLWLVLQPQPPSVVRRLSAASLPADDPVLQSYRTAIAAMQALPPSDPRNWRNIAQLHFDHCAHRNWYTWPWHRAYLLSFERICQQLSGDSQFRVPYWDWTSNRQVPATFMQSTFNGLPNRLFDSTRVVSQNDSLPDSVVGPTTINTILGEPNFEAFMSFRPPGQTNTDPSWQAIHTTMAPLEHNPHNYVHNWIGGMGATPGHMATLMSPMDPIFWLHHANIDRIWDFWNRLGNTNTSDPLWRNFRFSGQFKNPDGTLYEPLVSELLDILALGYTYNLGDIVVGPNLDLFRFVSQFDFNQLTRTSSGVGHGIATRDNPLAVALRTTLPLPQLLEQVLRRASAETAENVPVAGRALVFVEAEPPASMTSPEVRVFLNCEYLTPETPPFDPHYVGSFTFFPSGGAHREHGDDEHRERGEDEHRRHGGTASRLILDLTLTLITLRDAGRLPTDQLVLQSPRAALGGPGYRNDGVVELCG